MDEMKEIPGTEGYFCNKSGDIFTNKRTGILKKMKRSPDRNGYLRVTLVGRGSTPSHRLILETFVGPSNGLQCNHINGKKSDNRLENLEWVTCKQNIDHSINVLLQKRTGRTNWDQDGTKNIKAKISDDDVRSIRALKASGLFDREIAEKFPISRCQINKIVNGRNWSHM